LTKEDIEGVTNISTWFRANKVIETFDELERFTNVTYLGTSTTSSENGAFTNCTNLKYLSLPKSCTSLRVEALAGCTSLERVNGFENVKTISNRMGYGALLSQDLNLASVEGVIGYRSFSGTSIKNITSLGNCTALEHSNSDGEGVFDSCKSLVSVVIPKTLTTIGGRAFRNDTALKSVTGDLSSITTIGNSAFNGCTALVFDELNLPNLTSLGQNAFYGVKIKKLNLGALTTIPAGTTSTQNFGNKATLEEIVLSEDITTIPTCAFLQYKNLGGVVNHPNLTSIGNCAYNTTSISRIENLGSITTILGGNTIEATFGNCAKLYFVRLPATLTSIGRQAFYGCKALETFICEAVTPPSLDSTAFTSTNSTFVIYVPDASLEAYKSASNWSAIADYIKPLSEYTE
jgi:hypothetical protein